MGLVNYMKRSFNATTSLESFYHLIIDTSVLSISLIFIALIMATICCSSRLHTFPNLFVASLAVSDFIFAVACQTMFIIELHLTNFHMVMSTTSLALCFCGYLIFVSLLCSRICHFVISLERWLYIARPFTHLRLITNKSTACCLILVWVVSILLGLYILTNL